MIKLSLHNSPRKVRRLAKLSEKESRKSKRGKIMLLTKKKAKEARATIYMSRHQII